MNGDVDKREIHEFLVAINTDLREFIKRRIESGSHKDQKWSRLFEIEDEVPCWEVTNCQVDTCPVRLSDERRCWLVSGTLCGGVVQGVFAKKFGSCTKCTVFQRYHENPARSLFENINVLISHLSEEAHESHIRSITDALTGLPNRVALDDVLERERKRSDRSGEPLSMVVIDLDNFKQINDRHGHLVGDDYLKTFATILKKNTRATDYNFRIGGDEFLTVLVDCAEADISRYVARIEAAVERWNRDRPHTDKLMVSAGGASLGAFNGSTEACLRAADERMYQQKRKKTPTLTRQPVDRATGYLRLRP